MLLLLVSPARADTLRGLFRVTGPDDRALLERVRGQASDLAVTLEVEETPDLPPNLRDQLAEAQTLAAGHEARVVIWARRTAEFVEIVVADLALDRVLVRALADASSADERSARDEAAALVVRSALKASLAGVALGSSPKELLPVAEPAPVVDTPKEPAPVPPEPAPRPTPRKERWLAALGGLAGGDGVGGAGRYAVSARVGWFGSRWELGLRGGYGFGVETRVELARLTLAQHRLEAYVEVVPLVRETVRLGLLAGAGARLFSLHVDSTEDSLSGESGRKVLVSVSALAALRVLPTWSRWQGGRAGIELSAGLDVLPRALELGYRDEERFVVAETLWRVQPVGAVEVVLVF